MIKSCVMLLPSCRNVAATHRNAASLSYAMGLISHYGQQGWNKKEEVIKIKN